MLLGVVEVLNLAEVLQNLGELARPAVTDAGKRVSRYQEVSVACRLREALKLPRFRGAFDGF